jgi:cytochrome b561
MMLDGLANTYRDEKKLAEFTKCQLYLQMIAVSMSGVLKKTQQGWEVETVEGGSGKTATQKPKKLKAKS